MHHRACALLMLFASVLLATPAMALPIIFTDRASFDAAVGQTTLLTFDTLPQPVLNPGHWEWHFDDVFVVGSDTTMKIDSIPGTVCFCNVPNGVGGGTPDPVWAVGFDITPLAPNTQVLIDLSMTFILSQPQFLGFLYSEPTAFRIQNVGPLGPAGFSEFTIDNVAIQTTPEPASLVLLAVGFVPLVWCRMRNIAV